MTGSSSATPTPASSSSSSGGAGLLWYVALALAVTQCSGNQSKLDTANAKLHRTEAKLSDAEQTLLRYRNTTDLMVGLDNGTLRADLLLADGTQSLDRPGPGDEKYLREMAVDGKNPGWVPTVRIKGADGQKICDIEIDRSLLGKLVSHQWHAKKPDKAITVQNVAALCGISEKDAAKGLKIKFNAAYTAPTGQPSQYVIGKKEVAFAGLPALAAGRSV